VSLHPVSLFFQSIALKQLVQLGFCDKFLSLNSGENPQLDCSIRFNNVLLIGRLNYSHHILLQSTSIRSLAADC